jgi:hypothetical protein
LIIYEVHFFFTNTLLVEKFPSPFARTSMEGCRPFNEEKYDVDIPIVTYRKEGGYMDFNLKIYSELEENPI